MDDPDIVNSVGVAVEQADTMTSLSPSKRTIALGVVNTSGMKSSSSNRKRRWDQPPDESGEMPCVKKVHLNETVESPESALERLNEESIDSPNKCSMLSSNEPDTVLSNSDQVMSDGNAMSVDVLPEEVCDRLGGLPEDSNVTSSSEHYECKSTVVVGSAVECSGSVCDEKVNNISSDLRLGVVEGDKETDAPLNPVNESSVVTSKEQKRKTSTVISHQSDELRRIMFSYNEGTSESDSNDSNGVSLSADSSDNKTKKAKFENSEDISKLESIKENSKPNINPFSETSISLNENRLLSDEKENCLSDENLTKGLEKAVSKSYNDVDSIEMVDSSIIEKTESQINIPNKNELLLNTLEVNCVQVSDNFCTGTGKTLMVQESDSISSIKSDEQQLISDITSKRCNEQLECDSSTGSKTDNPISEADSMRLLDENVRECSHEAEINKSPMNVVPVDNISDDNDVNTLQSYSKIENFSDLRRDEGVISEINDVKKTEMLIETTEICKVNKSGSDTSCLTTDSTTNFDNERLPEKSVIGDSYKTEQLPNLSNLKENSIEVNESCLDDENSNTLKSDVEEPSNDKMTCDFNSDTHLKIVNSDSEKILDPSSKTPNTDTECSETLKSCFSTVETSISNTDESELKSTIVNISSQSEIGTHNNSDVNESDVGSEKFNKNPTDLPSDDIDSDVMKVILEATDDSSKAVDSSKDKVSSIELSTPDSDSNASKSTLILDNQSNSDSLPDDLGAEDSTKESFVKCENRADESTEKVDTSIEIDIPESMKENVFEGNSYELEESVIVEKQFSPESQDMVSETLPSDMAEEGDIVMEEEELIDKQVATLPVIDINEKQTILVEHDILKENEILSNEVEMAGESSIMISESKNEEFLDHDGASKHLNQEETTTVLFSKPLEGEAEEKEGEDKPLIIPMSEENSIPQVNSFEDEISSKVELTEPHENKLIYEENLSEPSGSVLEESPIISDNVELGVVRNESANDEENEIAKEEKSESSSKTEESEVEGKTKSAGAEAIDTMADNKIHSFEIEVEEKTEPLKADELEPKAENKAEPINVDKIEMVVDTKIESTKLEETEIVEDKTQSTSAEEIKLTVEDNAEPPKIEETEIVIDKNTMPPKVEETEVLMEENIERAKIEETEVLIEENTELNKVEDTEIVLEDNTESDKVEEIEIIESSAISQDDKEDSKSDSVQSPSIINEPIVTNNEDSKGINEEIETFDVVEEVVTCENSGSEKAVEPEIEDIINEDENAQFASEETQESVESSDDLVAVMDNDTSDAKASDSENQNIVISTDIFINADENLSSEAMEEKENMEVDDSVDIPCERPPAVEIMCKTASINSIAKVSTEDEEMEVDELLETKKSLVNEVKNDIPLLKTVSSPSVQKKEQKIFEKGNVAEEALKITESINPSLEPTIMKVYKDNLSIKTDDLDSPKKHKSPKESPRSKTLDNICSLSPQNKQFEYTLKIAKDVNTNIPKATMSPKSNMSPSWKLESSPNSPHSPGESGISSLKLKLSKPSPSGLSNDLCSSSLGQSNKLEDSLSIRLGISEEKKKEESKTLLPKQPLEMGSALKMMMEVDKAESSRPEGTSILEQALSGSVSETPATKKRGRPRLDNDINHSPKPNPSGEGEGGEAGDSGALDTSGEDQGSSRQVRSCRARTQPIITKARKPRGGGATPRGGGRGGARGVARPIASAEEAEKIQEKLSEKEKAELAKIEARKEKMRLDRIAKNEAKKAKKLAKKLKDEERRKRVAAEKAEKAAAAAPQVFEEETRMSASESRGHTPAPSSRLMQASEGMDESQYSIGGTPFATPKTGNHKGRMEIPIDPESDEVRVDQLAEYQWQGSELCMIQEQVSLYLGVKSFKRKYPDLRRRIVEAEERAFLEDSGLVSKNMCDLGLTAVSSAEILDIMYQDFPDKYEAFRQYVRDKQAKEMSFKQKALASQTQTAKAKGELRELALEAAAMWNSNLNRERREERRCALDLQTFTVHYPKHERERMAKSPLRPGLYPVSVIPGQFSDYYKTYTPTELMYFPLNTVMYGPLKPNERRDGSDSSSSSSDDSSGTSDSENDSDDEERVSKECKICNGEKKSTSETHPEILLQCSQCKGLCHPTCQEITPEMLPHIKKYSWHCSNCKKCVQCKDTSKEEKMLFCDLCDRGYHISCVGLRKSPEGRWHCSVCSFCTLCGSKDPGGAEWFYEYKKTDKGVRLYQRTLCVPCSKNALM